MSDAPIPVWPLTRPAWAELAPMVHRIARIAAQTPIRLIESGDGRRTAMARLPSQALVARSVAGSVASSVASGPALGRDLDVTARAGPLDRWLCATRDDGDATDAIDAIDGDGGAARNGDAARNSGAARPPERVDASWRGGRPPRSGWQRIDQVPGAVVRELLHAGAQAHLDAANQGMGARAADILLDTAVLTVSGGAGTAEITNRSLSALVGMGFLPDDGHIVVAASRGWTRVAAEFGSTYIEPRRDALLVL